MIANPLSQGNTANAPPTPIERKKSLRESLTNLSLGNVSTSVRTSLVVSSSVAKFKKALLGADEVVIQTEDDDEDFDPNAKSRKEQKKELRAAKLKHDPHVEAMIRELTLQQIGPRLKDESFKGKVKEAFRIDDIHHKIIEQRVRVATMPPKYPGAHKLVTSMAFEVVMGTIIMSNAMCIGWDTFYDEGEARPVILAVSEHIFTFVFVVEFFIRLAAFSWVWLFSLWNFCDACLVWIGGVFMTWILAPANVDVGSGRMMQALRIMRIARLCRILRLMPQFRELWILVQGLTDSFQFIVWMYVIAGTVHFMFAIAMMELIGFSPEFRDDEVVQEWFGTLIGAMFTLFQIMTFDSYSGILRYIMFEKPESLLLIGAFMGVAGIVLMNLMTAIVVENAFAAAAKDEEAVARLKQVQAKKTLANLRALFKELDEDASGALSKDEFTDVLDDPMFVQQMKALDIELSELPTIFDIFDDGDGQISTDEFCNGLMKMQGRAMNRDMLIAMKKFRKANKQVDVMSRKMDDLAESNQFFDNLDDSCDKLRKIVSLTSDILECINKKGIMICVQETKENLPDPPSSDFSKPPPADDVIGTYLQKLHRRMQGKEELMERKGSKDNVGEDGGRSASKRTRSKGGASRPRRNKGGSKRGSIEINLGPKVHHEVPESMKPQWDMLGLDFDYRGPPRVPKRPTVMAPPVGLYEEPPVVLVFDSGPIGLVGNGPGGAAVHHPNAVITTPRQENGLSNTLLPSEVQSATDAAAAEAEAGDHRRGAFPALRPMPGAQSNASGANDLDQQMNPLQATASRHEDNLQGAVRTRGLNRS